MPSKTYAFNLPYVTGNEVNYIQDAVSRHHLSGNGYYTKRVHEFFKARYGFPFCLLTTSCTDALEMAALLLDINADDEVILPSYTFVSTANAFALRGARLVFVDTLKSYPNINVEEIERAITSRTKAIIAVHYAGAACDMEAIKDLCVKHQLYLVEDAAQAIDAYYNGKPLGSFGDLSCFSFHETKNIHCGEGGLLVVNNEKFKARSEILWEKGTNRSAFFRGQIDKYNWVDLGSSFLPSELNAAFLFAQLEQLDAIQAKRKAIWKTYYEALAPYEYLGFKVPEWSKLDSGNSHLFFITCSNGADRSAFLEFLKSHGIYAVFHYLSLHSSPFFKNQHPSNVELPNAEHFSETLVRLPFYVSLSQEDVLEICRVILLFYQR